MPQKSKSIDGYRSFTDSLTAGHIGSFYIFHGEERYLLERSLTGLRSRICPEGLSGFNYRRFEGKRFSVEELDDAINTLPAFAERTLIEIHDFDIFKSEEVQRLGKMLADLPEYVCLVFIYDILPYKPDGRLKANTEILKYADVVEFLIQDQDKLAKWIKRHFADAGKNISAADAEYLAFITGGYMTILHGEIEKTASYSKGQNVTRADIDAVVTPVLDTAVYKLTDALARREYISAMRTFDELLQMREAPHKLMYSISLKMRQLLSARVCIESGLDKSALRGMCGLRDEYQARILMDTARRLSLHGCKKAVLHCAETALELNSTPDPEARLVELITKLAYDFKGIAQ